MTEEEAKKKWCPFAKPLVIGNKGWSTNQDDNYNCIGSYCMAWRETKVAIKKGELTSRVVEERIDGFTAEYGPAQEDIPAQGYCGLAGKP